MKIALIGYGKMGKTIEALAQKRGHTIESIVDPINEIALSKDHLISCDIAIEFTNPKSAPQNILSCIEWGIPIVSGTTGWLENLPQVKQKLNENPKSAFFYASNYSLGVNVFFELNRKLAFLMNPLSDYEVSMNEIHHTQKLDAPSGTGITLAEDIIENLHRKTHWVNHDTTNPAAIALLSDRIDNTPGTHSVAYNSSIDSIEIIHTAHSRDGFALGAILAAEWTIGKRGELTMKDMLGF